MYTDNVQRFTLVPCGYLCIPTLYFTVAAKVKTSSKRVAVVSGVPFFKIFFIESILLVFVLLYLCKGVLLQLNKQEALNVLPHKKKPVTLEEAFEVT